VSTSIEDSKCIALLKRATFRTSGGQSSLNQAKKLTKYFFSIGGNTKLHVRLARQAKAGQCLNCEKLAGGLNVMVGAGAKMTRAVR